MKTLIKKIVKKLGYDLRPNNTFDNSFAPDATDEEKAVYEMVKPFTMTGISSVINLIGAVRHIIENKIEGDFVECGVWRGGSMMTAALTLKSLNEIDRNLFLYDTFSGMVAPTDKDRQFDGKTAAQVWRENSDGAWCDASLQDVKNNMNLTGYPSNKIHYVEGKIEETIPQIVPKKIALLRLDTDWYESTKHELEYLYPLLVPGGILIIDDYGHWSGSKTATDEFFARQNFKPLLHRIDYTRRMIIKPQEC
jgi:hypothetical protein